MRSKIICVGNGFVEQDSIGTRLFEYMKERALPEGVSIADGGLAGLDNYILMKDIDRVVFVDAVKGFGRDGGIIVFKRHEVSALADCYGHSAGLPYLFYMAEHVLPAPLPEMLLVGSENGMSDVVELAAKSLEVALHGAQ